MFNTVTKIKTLDDCESVMTKLDLDLIKESQGQRTSGAHL
jgi:hypothetical protein